MEIHTRQELEMERVSPHIKEIGQDCNYNVSHYKDSLEEKLRTCCFLIVEMLQ